MKSDGGLAPVDDFGGHQAILSGPAGGVVVSLTVHVMLFISLTDRDIHNCIVLNVVGKRFF